MGGNLHFALPLIAVCVSAGSNNGLQEALAESPRSSPHFISFTPQVVYGGALVPVSKVAPPGVDRTTIDTRFLNGLSEEDAAI